MKKYLKENLFLLSLATLTLTSVSCKKFDEGGRIGAADKNIVSSWTIDYAKDIEDGTDITQDYAGETWEFTDDGKYLKDGSIDGTYQFTEDQKNLIILENDGGSENYEIIKLTSDEMWLEELGSEEIHLTKK